MSGVVLEKAEFAYLLAVLHADAIVGVDDPTLFPVEKEARDATLAEGFRLLQEHGWLTPIGDTGQRNLDDLLLLMAAVIADPVYVSFTVRNAGKGNQQLLLHYVAEPEIVELSTTPEQKYRLGTVPDRKAMVQRIGEMLGLPEATGASRFQFSIDEPAFLEIQGYVAAGQREQAAAMLRERGVNGKYGEALLSALSANDAGGMVIVARPSGGQIAAGRKIMVFSQADMAWLARREDAETTSLSVETIQADTLPTVVNGFMQYLEASGQRGERRGSIPLEAGSA